ncbi:MAG: cytochrome P450 [Acidobacteriota bacterium]
MAFWKAFEWRGTERVYELPWMKNRIEFTARQKRVKEFLKSDFTRSQLTMDMLSRYHLSHDSMVVSGDGHAMALKAQFMPHVPGAERYPAMAKKIVDAILAEASGRSGPRTVRVSGPMIRQVYPILLVNLLGITITRPLEELIAGLEFRPGSRPMRMSGVLYAFSQILPGSAWMRALADLLFYRGERYTRKVATRLEREVFELAVTQPEGWYAQLLDLKASGDISTAEFRGEVSSLYVSSFTLGAALSSMVLCLAWDSSRASALRSDEKLRKFFVYEVLRLYPPFRNFGYEHKGASIQGDQGHRGQRGVTDLMVAVHKLHKDPDTWGDPGRFRPERFACPMARRPPSYMPFGLGRRVCSGRLFSLRLMTAVLEYLCSEDFGWELRLPGDYRGRRNGLPIPVGDRLISFPKDDRVEFLPLDPS